MKKLLCVMIVLTLIGWLTTGCKKDKNSDVQTTYNSGVYHPEKQIRKIINSSGDYEEIWFWNGNNLSEIHKVNAGVILSRSVFSYENDRFAKITLREKDLSTNDSIINEYRFFYNQTNYDRIEYYNIKGDENELISTYSFEYSGSRIFSIKNKWNDVAKKQGAGGASFTEIMRFIMPEIPCHLFDNQQEKNMFSEGGLFHSTFTWDRNNISEMSVTFSKNNQANEETATILYEYDNSSNPFYRLLISPYYTQSLFGLSLNNVIKETFKDFEFRDENGVPLGVGDLVINNHYIYDEDNYPIERLVFITYPNFDPEMLGNITHIYTEYFEYN